LNLEDAGVMVLADEDRVVQVLVNLLTNASKYGPAGQTIQVSSRRLGDFVRVQVQDQGPGIAPEARSHLFERFYRAKRGRKEATGLGLGLALAKAIVEAHGGQIGVESEPGHGAIFWFTLPEAR